MESPPLPENYWTDEFSMVDFFQMQHQYLSKAYRQVKKRLPKTGQTTDPVVMDLVGKYVDLQFRLGRLEQLEIERQILEDSRELMDKVGLPSMSPIPIEHAMRTQVMEYLLHQMFLMDRMEECGLKKKKSPPPKLYSPTRPHQK